jgi:basic membrane protein A
MSYPRFRFLTVGLAATLLLAACGGGPAATPTPTPGPKIGVVTDIGQLEDKSFNEYSWKGVQDGAAAIGAPAPKVIITRDIADYKQNIQSFVDQKFDVILTVGFLIGTETGKAATANPKIQFFGIDQFVADPAPPNYQGLLFNEAQAGYLAGIVAGTITKSGKIGTVGGRSDVPPVVSYIKGYGNGARSVKPGVQVLVNYTEDFNAPDKGEASARTMIGQGADVIFQVAGLTGAGSLRAACSAGKWGIGVDVDQYQSLPDAQKCIVTSAEKHLQVAAREAIKRWKANGKQTSNFFNDAKNAGIGYSPIRNLTPIPAGLEDKLKAAIDAMKAGTLNPNP